MKIKGIFYTILSAVLFGVNPLLSKQIYAMGGNSVTLTFFRMMITAVTFWIVNAVWMHKDYSVSRDEFKKLFFCAQGYCLTPYLLWSSYNYLPSGMATTIHFVYPVLVLIGSIVFYHERLTRKKAVSCLFCVTGILCLCQADGTVSLMGFLLAFVSGIVYTLYILLLDHCGLVDMHPYKLSFWLSGIGTVEIFLDRAGDGEIYVGHRSGRLGTDGHLCPVSRCDRLDGISAWYKVCRRAERLDALDF